MNIYINRYFNALSCTSRFMNVITAYIKASLVWFQANHRPKHSLNPYGGLTCKPHLPNTHEIFIHHAQKAKDQPSLPLQMG